MGALQRYESQQKIFAFEERTHLDGMAHLAAVVALDLGPVLRLGTIAREVALLLAVAALRLVGVARLVTILGDMILGIAVAASARTTGFDVRTL